ncbi:MAG: four helix bundle protein [Candidatus Tantalella remota]|nr:four helix bundle protein [Candidatus Tantalella remota]
MHKELEAWKQSMLLTEGIYVVTKSFPDQEKFGLVNQLRRAAVSVPSNIAEGAARDTTKEFIRFLYIALGSISEVKTQLILSERLRYSKEDEELLSNAETVKKLLFGLIKALKKRLKRN